MSFGPPFKFSRAVNGLVPAPGGSGTTRYLREDATWDTPAGGTTPTLADVLASGNSAANGSISDLYEIVFETGFGLVDNGSGGLIASGNSATQGVLFDAFGNLNMQVGNINLNNGSGSGATGAVNLDRGTIYAGASSGASITHDDDLGWNITDDLGRVFNFDSDNNGFTCPTNIYMTAGYLYLNGGGSGIIFPDDSVQTTAYTGVPALQSVTDAGSVTTDAVTVGTLTVSGDLFESGYSTTAPTLPADSMYGFWFDEGANNFKITVKKSTGTVETGLVPCSSGGTRSANTFFAGPAASPSATPTFRAIASADVPTLNQNTTGTAANITAASNATLTTLSALTTGPNSMLFVGQYPTTIAYASSITPAVTTNTNTQIVNVGQLTGPITINAPIGTFFDGQNIRFRFSQDSTGRAITWNATYVFGTDITSAMIPTTPSANFEVLATYNLASTNWRISALTRGF